ncbi:NACHT domain-containing protein [Streptomyces luteireticuli]|uniref:NACHT domain-containing protein n=1 Tax=Streptomyces luteireticuli TaxID=173858 RepID=A0ABN0Z9R8_9ACTN
MNDDPLAKLSLRLRILKAQRGLSMGGLQQRSSLGRTTVSQALNGSRLPSETTVVALARALGTQVEPLLALRQQACPPPVGQATSRSGPRVLASFEERYRRYLADQYGQLTVVGLDLGRPERGSWPLNAAYLSLELAQASEDWQVTGEHEHPSAVVRRTEQALAGQRRVLLKGLAGSGKTTLLQWLAVATATGSLPEELAGWHGRIPFVLPLRTLIRHGPLPQPHEFLQVIGTPLASSQPDGWVDAVLSDRALVLVDGVDEVPQEHRQGTRQWLEALLAAYEDLCVVVTTRPSAIPDGWLAHRRFTELTVRPMNAADTRVFINLWHTAARQNANGTAAHEHLRELETTLQITVRAQRNLSQLSTTPLMCALVCALHRERRGHLPYSRMELYTAALSMLLVRRDHERGIHLPEGIRLTEAESSRLLRRLAYWLIRNQQAEMDRATALALLADALPAMAAVATQGSAEQVLEHLINRTGLLQEPAADTIGFVHRTFQDYLGAQAAIDIRDFPLLVNHAHDDQWEDVIRMAIGHARPQEAADLLTGLVTRGDREEEHLPRLHLLAAASLHYATEIDPTIRGLVEQRAGALMPPRSSEEANLLARLGPGILDLLPRSADGLQGDEINAVIRTAATMGGDQAYAILQQFVPTLPPTGRGSLPDYELCAGWGNFDAQEFARDILLPLQTSSRPPTLTVRTREQADALRLLRPVRQITFRGAFTAEDITAHLSPEHTRLLSIYEGQELKSLRFIRDLPALGELGLSGCTRINHLEDLAGLPLPQLRLLQMPDTFRFDTLAGLPALTHLSLYTILPWRSLHRLPAPEDLISLALGGWISASVTGITRFPRLRTLIVNHPLDEIEWENIAALPNLTELYLGECDLSKSPRMLSTQRLTVSSERADMRLDLIPDRFPNLERLSLNCRGHAPDLTPLHEIPKLHITLTNTQHATGLNMFPPGTISIHPRPRTPPTRPPS